MRIVKIHLARPGTFWFYNNVKLGPGNTESEPFDFDALGGKVRDHILRSQNIFHYIKIVDQPEGVWPTMEIQQLEEGARYELPLPPGMPRRPVPPKHEPIKVKKPKKPALPPPHVSFEAPIVLRKDGKVLRKALQDMEPVIRTVTVEETEEAVVVSEPDAEDYAEAVVLLKQNGNTIKKVLRSMEHTAANRLLLKACIETERDGKNRAGVLTALEEAFLAIPPGAV
jgi:hypothetical protein